MILSRVTIFVKRTHFLSKRRKELYGTREFVSSCGGLLSLFLGVSLLSFVELLYFMTLRLVGIIAALRQR